MLYDLHLHTCLSPCADDAMTPATVAGMAKLAGAELIAITDHNSARNVPAAAAACEAYGLRLLPGLEANTAEEIHVLCYFATVDAALAMGQILYDALPDYPYDADIWGKQLILDENDTLLATEQKLLTSAVTMSIYEVCRACESLGGVAVPAHVDKDSYSLLSVLGFWDEFLPFTAAEVSHLARKEALEQTGQLPKGLEILHSSDAHTLETIATDLQILSPFSVLQKLL